jgi:hypothetical protein
MNPVKKILGYDVSKDRNDICKLCGKQSSSLHYSNKGGVICTSCVVSHGFIAGDNWVDEE